MRALVIYESMYGNTHLIAEAIAAGLTERGIDADAVPVGAATPDRIAGIDLLVIGGPTHAHGMSRETTRQDAIAAGGKPDNDLHVDPDAEGDGLREWFDELSRSTLGTMAAAFDTRIHLPAVLTGRASKGISRRITNHGYTEISEPESFFVTKNNELEPNEDKRAREWGRAVGTAAAIDSSATRTGSQ